jgi:hypothetical protein
MFINFFADTAASDKRERFFSVSSAKQEYLISTDSAINILALRIYVKSCRLLIAPAQRKIVPVMVTAKNVWTITRQRMNFRFAQGRRYD